MEQSRWRQLIAVYVLTTMGMGAALIAITQAINGLFVLSFVFALVGFVCDSLDGPLARYFGVSTRFGAYADASVDFMLYLVYPAVAWHFVFGFAGIGATCALTLFICSGLFRLIRTANRGVVTKGKYTYFIGVPVVLSLPLLAGSSIVALYAPQFAQVYFFGLLPLFALLMVSRIPFPKPTGYGMVALLALTVVFIVSLLVL